MDTQTPQPGENRSESSWTASVLSDTLHNLTQQEHRHQLVHRNTANAVTKHKSQDAHLKIVCKTWCSKKKKQHAIGCDNVHTVLNGGQMTL